MSNAKRMIGAVLLVLAGLGVAGQAQAREVECRGRTCDATSGGHHHRGHHGGGLDDGPNHA